MKFGGKKIIRNEKKPHSRWQLKMMQQHSPNITEIL